MTEDVLENVRRACLALPETTERQSHGEAAWFVRDKKMFVTFADHHHDDRVAIWCAAPHGAQASMVEADPQRYFVPAYVGTRGWLGVYLDVAPLDWQIIGEIIDDAYRAVAPRALISQLDEM